MRLRTPNPASRAAARAAFTLMEILVVLAIMLVLVGVATPLYLNYLAKARIDTARTEAANLAAQIKSFAISHEGQFPQENDWSALPLPPERKPPLDPWKRPYQWAKRQIDGVDGPIDDPVVWSGGPDGSGTPEGPCSSMH
jgi:general secretion pathway protein G